MFPKIRDQCKVYILVLGLLEWSFVIFLLTKAAIAQEKITTSQYLKLVLKTIYKKGFIKYHANAMFHSLCLPSGNPIFGGGRRRRKKKVGNPIRLGIPSGDGMHQWKESREMRDIYSCLPFHTIWHCSASRFVWENACLRSRWTTVSLQELYWHNDAQLITSCICVPNVIQYMKIVLHTLN